MLRLLAPIILALCTLLPAAGQQPQQWWGARIAKQDRVPNRSGSQCVFASLEALARNQKLTALYDLTQRYHSTSGPGQVAQVLSSRGVQFKQQQPGDRSTKLMTEAWSQGHGCLVGLSMQHAIVAAAFDNDKTLLVIDNSDPQLAERSWEWSKFAQKWDGWVVILVSPAAPSQEPEYYQLPPRVIELLTRWPLMRDARIESRFFSP